MYKWGRYGCGQSADFALACERKLIDWNCEAEFRLLTAPILNANNTTPTRGTFSSRST
jgi:hypothetical protein